MEHIVAVQPVQDVVAAAAIDQIVAQRAGDLVAEGVAADAGGILQWISHERGYLSTRTATVRGGQIG